VVWWWLVASAWAWTADPAGTTLAGQGVLFEGSNVDTGFWPAGSPLQVRFVADADADLAYTMAVDSALAWPDAFSHELLAVPQGGLLVVSSGLNLVAEVTYDLFGFSDTWEVWSDERAWSGSTPFDSLLLAGHGPGAVGLRADPEDGIFGLDVALPLLGGLALELGGDVVPSTTVTVTGTAVSTNGVRRSDAAAIALLEPPAVNRGFFDIETWWEGVADGSMSVLLVPWLSLCLDADCYEVASFELGFEVATSGVALVSDDEVIQHALPALELGSTTLDLGTVTVGERVEATLEIHDLGAVPVEGEIGLIGEGFELYQDRFYATADAPGPVVVRLEATEAGQVAGTLTLWANDPVSPVWTVPVVATAIAPDVPAEAPLGESYVVRTCGCGAGGSPVGGWLLVALAGVLRRRSTWSCDRGFAPDVASASRRPARR
jgi:hypothetical protein